MKCCECKKYIPTKWFWAKYVDGKKEYFCNECAASKIDERSYNGFMLVHKDEVERRAK